jgi:hypothetical protein
MPMSPTAPPRKAIQESPGEDAFEHEWAEFNLPAALLRGLSGDDEDLLAFLGLSTDLDSQLPDGT